MMYKQTTQVPNIIFDQYLPLLTESELKILLVVTRQTFGWVDRFTGKRKTRDRISRSQFMQKTGLSRKIVSLAINKLVKKGLLEITDQFGNFINSPLERKGKYHIYYSIQPGYFIPTTRVNSAPKIGYNCTHNKTNYTKETNTKLRMNRPVHIGEIIRKYGFDNDIKSASQNSKE